VNGTSHALQCIGLVYSVVVVINSHGEDQYTRWMQDIVGWVWASCTMVWKCCWVWARSK